MKKKYLIASLFIFGILMLSSFTFAILTDDLKMVKEQVECVFTDSTITQVCSSNKGSCMGVGSCFITILGKRGEQVVWKNSCENKYAYTTIDEHNKIITFNCGRTTIPTTFYSVFWECYDGRYVQIPNQTLLNLGIWGRHAMKDCENRCYKDGSKCGLNQFGYF